jgi:hypothetical protein
MRSRSRPTGCAPTSSRQTEDLQEWVPRFNDEGGIWYADVDPLYARYVSNDTTYGYDLGAVAAELRRLCGDRTGVRGRADHLVDGGRQDRGLQKERKRLKSIALRQGCHERAAGAVAAWLVDALARWRLPRAGAVASRTIP